MTADAPVLSAREYAADRDAPYVDAQGNPGPGRWYIVPGRRLRNDGVSLLTLYPHQTYRLTHNGTGWLLAAEHENPHRYLVDDALTCISSLPGAHAQIKLEAGREYEIAQDGEYGAWRVRERVAERA